VCSVLNAAYSGEIAKVGADIANDLKMKVWWPVTIFGVRPDGGKIFTGGNGFSFIKSVK
jgi:hypothetical protein